MSRLLFISISSISFIISLYYYKKASPSKIKMLPFLALSLFSTFLFIMYGVSDTFTGNGIDEATIYHLKYGFEGAGFLEYAAIIAVTTVTILLSTTFLLCFFLTYSRNNPSDKRVYITAYLLLFISLIFNPATVDIYKYQAASAIAVAFPTSRDSDTPTDFDLYYKKAHLTPASGETKNIVFVYAESLERTYFDEDLFPGLIKGLKKLESKSTYFTDIRQAPGTGWTVGGITASQCGIPLYTASHGNSMSGMDQFLSSAICLGDALRNNGYHQVYLGGASLDFAGKGNLFKTHGFSEVLGRDELESELEDPDYKNSWGLYDDSILEMAYDRFLALSKSGKKFGLFTLTLDTHHPKGHQSESCQDIEYEDGSNPILNAVACSDYLISNFVQKIMASPHADNTVIVIASDHLAMKNTATDRLETKERKNMFMIIEPKVNKPTQVSTTGSTLDIGSTLLPFIGYNGEIGLGRDLLKKSEQSQKNIAYIQSNLGKWKAPIMKLWDFPKIEDRISINIKTKKVQIDDRNFILPVLIELDDELKTTLKFQHDTKYNKNTLVEHLVSGDKSRPYILIDKCKNAHKLNKSLGKKGVCLVAGKGKKYYKMRKLKKNIVYTADEVNNLLNTIHED